MSTRFSSVSKKRWWKAQALAGQLMVTTDRNEAEHRLDNIRIQQQAKQSKANHSFFRLSHEATTVRDVGEERRNDPGNLHGLHTVANNSRSRGRVLHPSDARIAEDAGCFATVILVWLSLSFYCLPTTGTRQPLSGLTFCDNSPRQ